MDLKIINHYLIGDTCILEHYPNFLNKNWDDILLKKAWDKLDNIIIYPEAYNSRNRKSCSTISGHCFHTIEYHNLPSIIRDIIKDLSNKLGYKMQDLNHKWFVHINMYFNGVGIGAHRDREVINNNFIFSYTLLMDEKSKKLPRKFEVGKEIKIEETDKFGKNINKKKFQLMESIILMHGDGCRMNGSKFQNKYLHRIKSKYNKKMIKHKRLNITIRPMEPNQLGIFNWPDEHPSINNENIILPPISGWAYKESKLKKISDYFYK